MADPLWLYKLKNGLLGSPDSMGMLSEDQTRSAQNAGIMDFGAALLAAGGPSREPVSLGQALGGALMQGRQSARVSGKDALQSLFMKQKLEQAKLGANPSDVLSFQFFDKLRKEDPAAYDAYVARQNKQNVPSSMLEVEAYEKDPALLDKLSKIAAAKIGAKYSPTEQEGAKGAFDRTSAVFIPQSTLEKEVAALKELSAGKAQGSLIGEARGALDKKGINAMNVLDTLELADPLIDVATGSASGAAVDKVNAFFGKSTTGDQAIAQLKIIQANLMTNMPRMEGPQSDRDVQLYKEAAGELGDPSVPRERKKAALGMIRSLQQKYVDGGKKPQRSREDILKQYGVQ